MTQEDSIVKQQGLWLLDAPQGLFSPLLFIGLGSSLGEREDIIPQIHLCLGQPWPYLPHLVSNQEWELMGLPCQPLITQRVRGRV